MYDTEVLNILKERYGTDEPGKCKKCVLDKRLGSSQFLPCGKRMCCLLTACELIKIENEFKEGTSDTTVLNISNMFTKMKILGFSNEIDPPWVIMENAVGAKYWLNPKNRTRSSTSYKIVIPKGELLICSNKESNGYTIDNISIFSSLCGDQDLVSDIYNVEYMYNKLDHWANQDGYINCIATDITGKKACLIVSSSGDRLMVTYDRGLIRRLRNDWVYIEFSDNKSGLIVTDQKLNILAQRNVAFAFKM